MLQSEIRLKVIEVILFNLFAVPIKDAENALERDHAVIAKNNCPLEDQIHMDSRGRKFKVAQASA